MSFCCAPQTPIHHQPTTATLHKLCCLFVFRGLANGHQMYFLGRLINWAATRPDNDLIFSHKLWPSSDCLLCLARLFDETQRPINCAPPFQLIALIPRRRLIIHRQPVICLSAPASRPRLLAVTSTSHLEKERKTIHLSTELNSPFYRWWARQTVSSSALFLWSLFQHKSIY